MSKTTSASVETNVPAALSGYKESANAVKAAHVSARKAIKDDPLTSDLAKKQNLEALVQQTKTKLDGIKADQETYLKGLRQKIEGELRGNLPSDASSVLLRRDAADRARRTDRREAMEVLQDAIKNGDATLAHALGTRARNVAWLDVAEAYTQAHPDTADSAAALQYVEEISSGPGFNLSNSITFSLPND